MLNRAVLCIHSALDPQPVTCNPQPVTSNDQNGRARPYRPSEGDSRRPSNPRPLAIGYRLSAIRYGFGGNSRRIHNDPPIYNPQMSLCDRRDI